MARQRDRLLVEADRLIGVPGVDRIDDGAAVLVEDGRIVVAGRAADLMVPPGPEPRRFSCPGGTILPGLIDCHVHLAFDASDDPVAGVRQLDQHTLFQQMATRAGTMLAAGVTTVRDLGDRAWLAARLRDEIADGGRLGPRILSAGAPLTVPDGHCWFLGGVVDQESPVASVVDRNAAAGVDLIKVMVTGGGLTKGGAPPWESHFDRARIAEVVREARHRGLPVAAHAHGSAGIEDAVKAGVDTVEHGTWMVAGGFDYRPDVVERIVADGIAVCPGVSPNWRVFAEKFGPERAEQVFGLVRRMGDDGVELIAGTDGGVPDAVFGDPLGSLEFYRYLGFDNARILRMATQTAARAIGLGAVTGAVRPGLRADLLVVAGDPTADLRSLRDPRLVVADGRPYDPATSRANPADEIDRGAD